MCRSDTHVARRVVLALRLADELAAGSVTAEQAVTFSDEARRQWSLLACPERPEPLSDPVWSAAIAALRYREVTQEAVVS